MTSPPRAKPTRAELSDVAGFAFTPDAQTLHAPLPLGPANQAPSPPHRVAKSNKAAEKPHFHGHRERLRNRFTEAGPEALADYELLELFLFRVVPRADTKALAKTLIAELGDLAAVFAADRNRIAAIDGAGAAVALELKVVQAVMERAQSIEARREPVVSSWSQLLNYCRTMLQHEKREQFRVLFLDNKNVLMRDELMGEGTIDHAPVYPREVVRRALELNAAALILVHNHPSGDPTPSSADVHITREIAAAAKVLGIQVHDHIVVGRHGVASFRTLGLL